MTIDKYTMFKSPQGGKTYIPVISRRWCKRAFFRARDAVAYRERVLERYGRMKEAHEYFEEIERKWINGQPSGQPVGFLVEEDV